MIEYSSLIIYLLASSSLSCSFGILLGRKVPPKSWNSLKRDWSIWDKYYRCPGCDEGFTGLNGKATRGREVIKYCACGTHHSKFVTWIGRWAQRTWAVPGKPGTYYWDWLPKEKMVEDIEEKKYSEKEFQLQLKTQLELSELEKNSAVCFEFETFRLGRFNLR